MSDGFLWPWSVLVMLGFGVAYGILLHLAVKSGAYRMTGIRGLDYVLLWGVALSAALTPLMFYLAFGLKDFAETADGQRQQLRLKRTAQAEVALLILYGLAVLAFVPQKPMTA